MPLRLQAGLSIGTPRAAAAAPGTGSSRILNVPFLAQEEDFWCWAACCQMVFKFDADNDDGQCTIVSITFGRQCCASRKSAECDRGEWPEPAYGRYSYQCTRLEFPLSFDDVRNEIDRGRPIEVYYDWSDSDAAHVALVVGYYSNGELEVLDPWYGQGARNYDTVVDAYGVGAWTMTWVDIER